MSLQSKAFWVDAIERAVRTVAQVTISLLTVDGATPNLNVNWEGVLTTAALAGGISLLMSIVASGTGDHDSAALLTPERNA